MRDVNCEKSPGADLPFYFDMATGDAAAIYAATTIASLTITDWDGAALSGITVVDSFSGSVVLLRISGGTLATTYRIKVKVNLTNPTYKDELFVTLVVRHPPTS